MDPPDPSLPEHAAQLPLGPQAPKHAGPLTLLRVAPASTGALSRANWHCNPNLGACPWNDCGARLTPVHRATSLATQGRARVRLRSEVLFDAWPRVSGSSGIGH